MDGKVGCFTGHRPQSLPWGFQEEDPGCVRLKKRMEEEILRGIQSHRLSHFLSGMALGVDTWGAEMILKLQKQMPITLECVLPCSTQPSRWKKEDQMRYHQILHQCDKVTLLQEAYSPSCFDRRNRYMVDHSDWVLAVWDGRPSGTGQTVNYAHCCGKSVQILRP